MRDAVSRVARAIDAAESILFITGAGVSADSGLPTYRGVGGLYEGTDTEDGVAIEAALSGPMLRTQPALTWKYLWQIATACRDAVPNAAHRIIAEIELEKRDVWVVTQNVDGLHRAAGSRNLVEVHGHMYDISCTACEAAIDSSELFDDSSETPDLPPRCRRCGGVVRPQVVLFEEALPTGVVQSLTYLSSAPFELVVAVGTTAEFPYIREPVISARRRGAVTVEVNPARTSLSSEFDYRIETGAAEAFERMRER